MKSFLENNKWVLIASVFFIIWKFFLIDAFWKNGVYYEGLLDDKAIYLTHIESVIHCPTLLCNDSMFNVHNYTWFEHLSWRVPLGEIANIFQLNANEVFHLSFYFGTILLLLVLIKFLKEFFETDQSLIATNLFFLALFNGTGAYHGFFWVVPSFFSLLYLFLLIGILFEKNTHWKIHLLLLIPLSLFNHTISLYLIFLSLPFAVLCAFFGYIFDKKSLDIIPIKRAVFALLITAIFYIPASFLAKGNPYGVESFGKQAIITAQEHSQEIPSKSEVLSPQKLLNNIQSLPGYKLVKSEYLNWVFLNWLMLIPFGIIFLLHIQHKQFKPLAFFLTSCSFTIISLINENAVRSLLVLWPATFMFFATGTVLAFRWMSERFHSTKILYFLHFSLLMAVLLFSILNMRFSYLIDKDSSVLPSEMLPKSVINISSFSKQ